MAEAEIEKKENCRIVDGKLVCDEDKKPQPQISPSDDNGLNVKQLGKMKQLNCKWDDRKEKWNCNAKTEADTSPVV